MKHLKLIIGLGNPGEKYENTRHNIGFKAIDALTHSLNLELNKSKFDGIYCKTDDYIIGKPITFMNQSGDFVQSIASFYKIKPSDILVVYDDMDHKIGQAVIKTKGSPGGHNGLKDIIDKIGTEEIPRLKIGIGRPHDDSIKHVLGHFSKKELEILNSIKEAIVKAQKKFLDDNVDAAMNEVNHINR